MHDFSEVVMGWGRLSFLPIFDRSRGRHVARCFFFIKPKPSKDIWNLKGHFLVKLTIFPVKSAHCTEVSPNFIEKPTNCSNEASNPSDHPTHFLDEPIQYSEVSTRRILQLPHFTEIPTNSLDLPNNFLDLPTNFMDEKAKKHHNAGCFPAISPAQKDPSGLF
ncbi:MAG: hypothetical protein NW218_22090 [Saprospiraceae bacterium]|nr:hypothetical protein [Saprospiraceae bacterium]